MSTKFRCPVCLNPLSHLANAYQCDNRHVFDVARDGYVNLLLAHKKRSKEPGDSPDMIRSRRCFLDKGFYDAISNGINEVVADRLPDLKDRNDFSVLDAGCGEGFYLRRLRESLARVHIIADCYGIDISKYAVAKASRRDRTISWAVANIVDIPFPSGSVDLLMNVFSLAEFQEFSRVLRPGGILLTATPGPRHLDSLREIIYPVSREHAPMEMDQEAKRFFSISNEKRIRYPLELESQEDIMDLLAMTPYFWNIDIKTKSRVEALNRLSLEVDVMITLFDRIAI